MTITEILRRQGYNTIGNSFYEEHIKKFQSWYQGNVNAFHHYQVYNGKKHISCKMHTLQMSKKICEDWADLLMNEKVKIAVDGEPEQAFINQVFADNFFAVKANEMQEFKMALGTVAYVPTAYGVEVDQEGNTLNGSGIRLNYVTADGIYPLRWENGFIHECAFAKKFSAKDKKYVYLQVHTKPRDTYLIQNLFFDVTNGVSMEIVPPKGYENIPREIQTASTKRQFVIDRPNIANNIDASCPLGISVFANSIDVLKGIDLAYDSYDNEFALGKKRIMVRAEAMNLEDGRPVFDENDLVYYQLPEGVTDEGLIKEIDMTLRCEQHQQGIQDRLNLLSSKCGLGESYYRFERGSIQTATQVISENSSMFRSVKKHEIVLEAALKELVEVLLTIGRDILKEKLDPEVEVIVDFDDSIIEDTSAEKQQYLQEIREGVRERWEYRARFFGETEDEAKKRIAEIKENEPSVTDLIGNMR